MSYQFGHVDRDERIDLAAEQPVGEPPRWSGLPTPVVTAAVIAVFVGSLWFAYHEGTRHPAETAAPQPVAAAAAAPSAATPSAAASGAAVPGEPPAGAETAPLIRANPQAIKVKPANPGGMPVPDHDRLIYGERPGGPPVERLLPPPEQPMPRPAPAPRTAALPPAWATPQQAPAASQHPQVPAARQPLQAQPMPAPERLAPDGPEDRSVAAGQPTARSHSAPAPIREVRGGRFRVRLASLRNPDQARVEWQRLKRLYPNLLGGLTADAVRDDLGSRGVWYRIVAGGFSDEATARRLCHELKERHQGCSVAR